MLEFVTRQTANLYTVRAFCTLYSSLVGPFLKYCNIVLKSLHLSVNDCLERVQIRFFKYLCFKFYSEYSSDNYGSILNCSGFQEVILWSDLIVKGFSNPVDNVDLLKAFSLRVRGYTTRDPPLIFIPFHHKNYCKASAPCRNPNIAIFDTLNHQVRKVLDF